MVNKLSIIVLKHCIIQVLLFNAYTVLLMEHKSTCTLKSTLKSSINNSDIVLSSTGFCSNGHGNKVVSVMFAYPRCEG